MNNRGVLLAGFLSFSSAIMGLTHGFGQAVSGATAGRFRHCTRGSGNENGVLEVAKARALEIASNRADIHFEWEYLFIS